jgi:hypothetical protein
LKENNIEYSVNCPANKINELIRLEIDRDLFTKKYSLNGDHSNSGGFNLFNTSFFPYFSYETAFVMLNVTAVNINQDGTKSKLVLKKMKALGYKSRIFLTACFTFLALVISIFLIFNTDVKDKFLTLIFPSMGILYFILIDYIASFRLNNMIKTIEKYLKNEGIEYKKL